MDQRKKPLSESVSGFRKDDDSPNKYNGDHYFQKQFVRLLFHGDQALRDAIAVYGFNFAPV